MRPIIRVEDLCKQYRIGAPQAAYSTFRESLAEAMCAPFKRLRNGKGRGSSNAIWALRDVSFDVMPGEVLGIIGRNGAGKSTLLKILSRVTEPTGGLADLYGRIGSLLEVGTGFHPELTGRENIYLNGAILGMHRPEIDRKFDEIVAFAEVEQFLNTPVKRYSSGMYVRLAFAIAVHLEPEVLVVDEVLSVGDAEFQKKCLRKMREVGRNGRTILFVSHNMAALRQMCDRGLLLDHGFVEKEGDINAVVDHYLSAANHNDRPANIETASFRVDRVDIAPTEGSVIKTFHPVEINITLTAKTDILDPGLYVSICSPDNQRLTGLDFKDFQTLPCIQSGQVAQMTFLISSLPLLPGDYQLELHLKDMAQHKVEVVPETFFFSVVETSIYGGRKLDGWYGHIGLTAQTRSTVFSRDFESS